MNKVIIAAICITVLGGVSALAQSTTAERAAQERFAEYEQTGEFQQCIIHRMIKRTTIVDDSKIMFELKGGEVLLNTLSNDCTNLSFERKFNYATTNSRLCAKDVISTRYGNCILGKFELLEEKPE